MKQKIKINTAAAEWFCYIKRHAETTQPYYRRVITNLIEFLDIKTIDQLNCRLIEKYISSLLDEGKMNSTTNTHLRAIKSFCRWLARNYDVKNYSKGIQKMKEDPTNPRVLTWEEYEKVLSVAKGQELDIVRWLANTGVRVSEFIGLKWGNISEDLKMLTVLGKGRKRRYVPLNSVCREILQKYERKARDNDAPLDFTRGIRSTVYKICAKLSSRAGIPTAGAHAYRHLFATELLRRGVPISYVSKLLGHSSIAITERTYIHFMPDYLNGITDVLADN